MEEFESRDKDFVERLNTKIKILSEVSWYDKWERGCDKLTRWLENFDEEDRNLARYMLSKFMYFNNETTRELMRRIYDDLYRRPIIHNIRRANGDTMDAQLIEDAFQKELENTRFLGIGNPSESSAHLLYYFRQENNLQKDLFISPHQLFVYQKHDGEIVTSIDNSISHIVILDDFCGSGSQATEFENQVVQVLKAKNPSLKVSYFCLYAIECGINKVRKLTYEDSRSKDKLPSYDEVKSIFILDDTYRCFSDSSRFFKNNEDKEKCRVMCKKYGEELFKRNPLGYKNGQMLIGFHHNTPNNTLPIFWSEIRWVPIFKRYAKRYSNEDN